MNVAVHKRYTAFPRSRDFYCKGTINHVNALHSHLKQFMSRFRGVATRHLHTCLDWFLWRLECAKGNASATQAVAGQLATGTYQTPRWVFLPILIVSPYRHRLDKPVEH